MLPIIIIIVSMYFDGLLTNILPYIPNDLSLVTPMLTIVSLILIYPFYKKKERKYFITVFIVGMIYDLLYTNLLFFDSLVFLFFGIIIKFIYNNLYVSHIKLSLYIILLIAFYELIMTVFILIFDLVPITPQELLYKITHSLLLKILYGVIVFGIIRLLPEKFKRIDIN